MLESDLMRQGDGQISTTESAPIQGCLESSRSSLPGIGFRAALLLSPLPLVATFFIQLCQQRPHYQFVPIYLAALAGLCWISRPTELLDGGRPSFWQRVFLAAGFAVYVPAALLFSPWLGTIAWLLLLPAALTDVLPPPARQKLLPVWLISWFMIPPPFQWDVDLLQWLRFRTSQATGVVLDALGVIHLQAGNTFEVPGKQFFVEDACSGIHSLLSIVGIALLWAVYLRLPVLAAICSVICAAGAAIVLNILRILVVVLSYTRWELDLSKGWPHELLGLALFGIALLFLWSAQHFWLFWFSPLKVRSVHSRPEVAALPESPERHQPAWWPKAAIAALVLCVPQVTHGLGMLAKVPVLHSAPDPRQTALEVNQQSLPPELHGWKQIDYKPVVRDRHHREGEMSRQWTYQAPWGLVKVSFDFPFDGPHTLLECYRATGWTPSVLRTVPASETPGAFQQVVLKRREFEVGSLIYGDWDDQGSLVTPREDAKAKTISQRFLASVWNRITPAATGPAITPVNSYQFQVLVTSEFPIGESEQAELLQFFLTARDRLRQQFTAESKEQSERPVSSSTDS